MLRFVLVACAWLWLLSAPPSGAQPYALDPDTRDQVTFRVERKTTVENDEMTVVLAAVETDLDAARAADAVNRTMQGVLPKLRAREDVDFRTGSYSTTPWYPQPGSPQRPREQHWRVEQQLILASKDFDALRELVTELQADLQLRSVGFGLSQDRRIASEREMRAAALAAFREDAEQIRDALGARSYEIVELQLDAAGPAPVHRVERYAAMARADESAAPAPVVLEGGDSDVVAGVQARIQLLR